jgi:Fe-S-cluster containining protein
MTLCATCVGACCRLVTYVTPDEALALPPGHVAPPEPGGRLAMQRRDDGSCIALDPITYRCTVYATRPDVCRRFERGGARCLDLRSMHGIAEAGAEAAPSARCGETG